VTKEELAKIESRALAASPGPFHWVQIGTGPCDSPCITLDGRPSIRADQYLFAHAQSDIIALVAEVRRLRLQLEETDRTLDRYQRGSDIS
jgi:hypothetical protein